MEKQVHIIPKKVEEGQKYDPRLNSLVLKKAGSFNIAIKEIEDLKKQKPIAPKSITELSKEEYSKLSETARWNYDVDVKQYNIDVKKYNEKQKLYNERLKKFDDLNWTWQLVYNELDSSKITRNVDFKKGIHDSISFPKLLEGGGMAWLEAWHEKDKPKGTYPFGMYVQAEGVSEIVRAEWTDLRYETINQTTKVAFGSKVILHIYTAGLYGQEVEVHLADSDVFTPNDKLKISGKDFFTREVKVYKLKSNDINKKGISGTLTIDDAPVNYAQKIEIEVVLDNAWIKTAGENLKIFPIIKSIKTGTFFTGFSRSYLQVRKDEKSISLDQQPIPATNMPLIVGNVETNVAHFDHCKYTEIELKVIPETEKEKNRIVFKENNMISPLAYNIPIICADTDHFKDYAIELMNLNTEECRFDGKSNDHKKTSINILKTPENYKITNNNGKTLNFKAAFNYHPSNDNLIEKTSFNMLEYIWPVSLRDDNKHALELRALSCRYEKGISIIAYPDVKWALDFRFGMKGPEQYTHTNLPNYPRNSDEEEVEKKPQSRHSDSFEKAKKAGRINTYGMEKRANGMDLEFQLVLKAEYNKGEEIELADKYAQKIKKFLELLLSFKEGLDTLTNIDKINSGHKSAVKGIGKILKSPIIGTIDYPAISIGGKWQVAIKDETNEVYTDGKVALRFNPLLKGDVSLDIIAAVSYVPAFGQAVKAIEIALNAAGAELNFMLTIFGQVNVELEYALAEKGGSNLNLNGELGIKLVLSGKVKINLNAIIFSVDGEIQAEAYAVTSIKPKASIGHDKKGTFVEAKCDFMGINIVCIITAKGKNNQVQYKDTYNILDRKDDFVKGKNYIIES